MNGRPTGERAELNRLTNDIVEDDEFLESIGAKQETKEICAECRCIPDGWTLCCYGCKYDGLPGKPLVKATRWVLPWVEDAPERT